MTNEELEVNEAAIKYKGKVEKLLSTKLWQEVIEGGYFDTEALRLVDALGNPQLDPEKRDNIKNMLVAIPSLKNFISMALAIGTQAQMDIDIYHDGLREEGIN